VASWFAKLTTRVAAYVRALHAWRSVEAGQWLRAQRYPRPGESAWLGTVSREVRTVRAGVGVCDVSMLGKIDLPRPDAAAFLERPYTNAWKTPRPDKACVADLAHIALCTPDGTVSPGRHGRRSGDAGVAVREARAQGWRPSRRARAGVRLAGDGTGNSADQRMSREVPPKPGWLRPASLQRRMRAPLSQLEQPANSRRK